MLLDLTSISIGPCQPGLPVPPDRTVAPSPVPAHRKRVGNSAERAACSRPPIGSGRGYRQMALLPICPRLGQLGGKDIPGRGRQPPIAMEGSRSERRVGGMYIVASGSAGSFGRAGTSATCPARSRRRIWRICSRSLEGSRCASPPPSTDRAPPVCTRQRVALLGSAAT